MNTSRAMPAERQWDLLEEYHLNNCFDVAWIDTENIQDIAKCFRVDLNFGVFRNIEELFDFDGGSGYFEIWIGAHSPGWSIAIGVNGWVSVLGDRVSVDGRRVITHRHMAESAKLPDEGMAYCYDGKYMGPLWGIEGFQDCTYDLEVVYDGSFAGLVEVLLIMAGRVTGRFLDRDWFATPRVLYRIPKDAWSG